MAQCQETRGATGPGKVQFLTTRKHQRLVRVRASVTFNIYHYWAGPQGGFSEQYYGNAKEGKIEQDVKNHVCSL